MTKNLMDDWEKAAKEIDETMTRADELSDIMEAVMGDIMAFLELAISGKIGRKVLQKKAIKLHNKIVNYKKDIEEHQ